MDGKIKPATTVVACGLRRCELYWTVLQGQFRLAYGPASETWKVPNHAISGQEEGEGERGVQQT